MPPNSWRKGDAKMLLEWLDVLGVEKAVVFPPFACQMENDMRKANQWAFNETRKHKDRLIVFGTINPVAEDAISILKIAAAEGVKGIKIHPSVDKFDLLDARAMEFYGEASSRNILLDFHTGVHGTEISKVNPVKFDTILWQFPNLTLIFEHVGGRAFYEIMLSILYQHNSDEFHLKDNKKGRAYAGITSVLHPKSQPLWCLGAQRIEELVNIVGGNFLVYGMDFPWHTLAEQKRELKLLKGLAISGENKEKLLGGNLRRLLNIRE